MNPIYPIYKRKKQLQNSLALFYFAMARTEPCMLRRFVFDAAVCVANDLPLGMVGEGFNFPSYIRSEAQGKIARALKKGKKVFEGNIINAANAITGDAWPRVINQKAEQERMDAMTKIINRNIRIGAVKDWEAKQ